MVRAIQTAMHLFENHPNKDKIKFLVVPMAKEGLNLCNDFCRGLEYCKAKFSDPT